MLTIMPIVDGFCGKAPMGIHPNSIIDKHTLDEIEIRFEEINEAAIKNRQPGEIVKFWGVRRQCPICQYAITETKEIFVKFSLMLYDGLNRTWRCINPHQRQNVEAYAELIFEMQENGLDFKYLGNLSSESGLLEEVSELLKQMLTPFGNEFREEIIKNISEWIKSETLEKEWEQLLNSEGSWQYLRELIDDVSTDLFLNFFRQVYNCEGMPKNIADDPVFFSHLFFLDDLELVEATKSLHPAFMMAAKLLLKYKNQKCQTFRPQRSRNASNNCAGN